MSYGCRDQLLIKRMILANYRVSGLRKKNLSGLDMFCGKVRVTRKTECLAEIEMEMIKRKLSWKSVEDRDTRDL